MTASLQRSSSRRARRETLEAHLFLLPWTLGFLVLTIGPILASLGLSFTDWQVGLGLKFIGFQNFVTMFTEDDQFRKSLSVTFNYSAMALPTGIVVALMMAMLLNQNVPAIGVFRTIYYLPAVTSGVAVAMLWAWIFNGEFGLLNWALDRVGIEGPAWLLSTTWALPATEVMYPPAPLQQGDFRGSRSAASGRIVLAGRRRQLELQFLHRDRQAADQGFGRRW